MQQTLRRAGGALVMTVPKTYTEQNQLQEGSQADLVVSGTQMTVTAPRRPRYKLEELMTEMPAKFPLAEAWDEIAPVGKEVS